MRTNFRFSLDTHCWETLALSPDEIGYRATATLLAGGDDDSIDDDDDDRKEVDSIYVFGGNNQQRDALDHLWKYSLANDTWVQLLTDDDG